MAHGNLDICIDDVHIFGFNILETLLYVMRLKKMGIQESKIQESVKALMGYNIPWSSGK